MAIPDQKKRKTHIFRLIGKTRDAAGNVVDAEDCWLDLERFETFVVELGEGHEYKKINVRLKWYEDEAGRIPNHSRKTTTIKLVHPDEPDPDNPKIWFELPVVDMIVIRDDDQVIHHHFDNTTDNRGRKVVVRRIVHFDTTIDDDPANKDGGVIRKDDYKKIAASKDKLQYVDVEIIRKYAFLDVDQRTATRLNNNLLVRSAETPARSYNPGDINPPWRLDPLQNIVNVQWRTTSPKYAVMFGYAGDLGVLVMFDVDKTGKLIRRLQLAAATPSRGWTHSLGVGPGDTNDTPGPEVAAPVTVLELDWKGNMRAGCFGGGILYDAGINGSFLSLAEQAFYDADGHTIPGLPAAPARGVQKNGLWVTTESVASYTGDNLDWKLDIDVYEVLPGGKVLGASWETGVYGVYTLDPETGTITHFRKIGDDSDTSYNYDFDTSSNGDTYWMKNVDSGASAGATTVQRIDKDGVIVWEKVIGGPTNVANGVKGPGDRSIAVVENHGQVFFITHDQGAGYGPDRFPGSNTPDQPFNDVFVMAFDSDGKLVSRVKWGTNINFYVTGVDETFATTGGVTRRMNGVDSTPRYPEPAS